MTIAATFGCSNTNIVYGLNLESVSTGEELADITAIDLYSSLFIILFIASFDIYRLKFFNALLLTVATLYLLDTKVRFMNQIKVAKL